MSMPRTCVHEYAGSMNRAGRAAVVRPADSAARSFLVKPIVLFRQHAVLLLAGLLLLSLAARARQYFSSTSYWYDEAYLLVNIIDRTYAELIGPLRMCVVIPPLYLW